MDKKDIYEHLAKIYLDASLKKEKKKKIYPRFFERLFFISIAFIIGLTVFLFTTINKYKSLNSELALVLQPDVTKINFNFDPAKKEIYSLNLNHLGLTRFKALGFSVKTARYNDTISLRVEFTSSFKEKSEVYLKNIAHKWRDYKIDLSQFKGISEWSDMLNISFIVEEWNTREKASIVYIDNVRLLK